MKKPFEIVHVMSDAEFEEYLRVCQELYLELQASGAWPWGRDSQISEDLLESEET